MNNAAVAETPKSEEESESALFGSAPTAPSAAAKAPGTAKLAIPKPSTISINPNKVLQQVKPLQQEQSSTEPVSEIRNAPFTEEDLKAALDTYVQGLTPAKKHNLATIWTTSPIRFEGCMIHLTVTNKIQESLLEQERIDMLDQIRGKLNNREISLSVKLELPPEIKTNKILSNKERYESMASRNPALEQMKQQFQLDIESPH